MYRARQQARAADNRMNVLYNLEDRQRDVANRAHQDRIDSIQYTYALEAQRGTEADWHSSPSRQLRAQMQEEAEGHAARMQQLAQQLRIEQAEEVKQQQAQQEADQQMRAAMANRSIVSVRPWSMFCDDEEEDDPTVDCDEKSDLADNDEYDPDDE